MSKMGDQLNSLKKAGKLGSTYKVPKKMGTAKDTDPKLADKGK